MPAEAGEFPYNTYLQFASQIGLGVHPVTIAKGSHLFPSRTQKLSPLALMILGGQLPGKVGRRRFQKTHPEKDVSFAFIIDKR